MSFFQVCKRSHDASNKSLFIPFEIILEVYDQSYKAHKSILKSKTIFNLLSTIYYQLSNIISTIYYFEVGGGGGMDTQTYILYSIYVDVYDTAEVAFPSIFHLHLYWVLSLLDAAARYSATFQEYSYIE